MDEDKNDYNPEEEVTTGNWNTPKVELKEVEIKTGEEDESLFWSGRSKLYRWVNGEWKERGLGESKLLLHKKKGTIRFLLRQEKTLKVVANHYIYPNESYCKLVPNAGSEKIYAWTVKDFAEEPKIEQFALKFNSAEAAKVFKEKFDEAGRINIKLLNNKENEEVNEKGEKEEANKNDDVTKEKEKTNNTKGDMEEKNKEEEDNENKKEEKHEIKNEEKKEEKENIDTENKEKKEKEEKEEKEEKNEEKDNDCKDKVKSIEKNEDKKEEKNKESSENEQKENNKENIKREN
ncbi:ran binding protein 1, putative [Plasmodium gallinaceum]|uniref:Ran binding protein 1, putative n=1 Tax=Plasmodium gallinaceum TaxID=5849 RepID=A0A1J1GLM6_PLAGA|nr:ran binding protein 1, putative [Plasmodium gallinaceum]CRG93227.1 ran binding protein 1, putative [Plasmodium gallinaceum]